MEILGIGPLELLFIVLIALIVLGPKDMVKAGKTIGRMLRSIVSSDTWKIVNQASREVRNLPNRLIREAGIEELQKQLPTQSDIRKDLGLDDLNKSIQASTPKEFAPQTKSTSDADLSPWTTAPQTIAPPSASEGTDRSQVEETREEPAEELYPTPGNEDQDQDASPGGNAHS